MFSSKSHFLDYVENNVCFVFNVYIFKKERFRVMFGNVSSIIKDYNNTVRRIILYMLIISLLLIRVYNNNNFYN